MTIPGRRLMEECSYVSAQGTETDGQTVCISVDQASQGFSAGCQPYGDPECAGGRRYCCPRNVALTAPPSQPGGQTALDRLLASLTGGGPEPPQDVPPTGQAQPTTVGGKIEQFGQQVWGTFTGAPPQQQWGQPGEYYQEPPKDMAQAVDQGVAQVTGTAAPGGPPAEPVVQQAGIGPYLPWVAVGGLSIVVIIGAFVAHRRAQEV